MLQICGNPGYKARERLSCFVLITNLDQSYSTHEVLKQYKAQCKVETSFKFFKGPLFVGPVFLKKPSCVQALAYVLLMALLIFNLLERRVREAMKHERGPLVIPGKVKAYKPTVKKILENLEMVMTMTTSDPSRRAFSKRFNVQGGLTPKPKGGFWKGEALEETTGHL